LPSSPPRFAAWRSAGAAKEIKALIGTSVDKVETGSKLVADAGATMIEIVASVQRVSDIIGEITAATSEQSDGIGQVNAAVTQLDRMTQQNATLVGQSSAAAKSLKEQAARLAQVVDTFQLADATRVNPPQAVARPPTRVPSQPAGMPPKAVATAPKKVIVGTRTAGMHPGAKPRLLAATAADKIDTWETF
jgi:methyl-accepting chemotaxis protein